jgi:hypothetical protein
LLNAQNDTLRSSTQGRSGNAGDQAELQTLPPQFLADTDAHGCERCRADRSLSSSAASGSVYRRAVFRYRGAAGEVIYPDRLHGGASKKIGVYVTLDDPVSSWCRNQQKETNHDCQT